LPLGGGRGNSRETVRTIVEFSRGGGYNGGRFDRITSTTEHGNGRWEGGSVKSADGAAIGHRSPRFSLAPPLPHLLREPPRSLRLFVKGRDVPFSKWLSGAKVVRPLRIEFPGAWYHVANRGAGRRPVFVSDDDRESFLELLGELEERFGVEIHAYSLAGNQYHLLVHTPNGGLGRGMRHLDGVYTQRYNRRQHSDGPLFRGRYKAIVVDPDAHLARVSRYIHSVPLALGVGESLKSYRWSSCLAYIKAAEEPHWLHTKTVLSAFGQKQRRKRYRAYMKDGIDEQTRAFYAAKRMAPVLGGAAFRDRVREHLGTYQGDREHAALEWLRERPTIKRIVKATAEVFGVPPKRIYESRRGRGSRNIPRVAAMALCRSPRGHSLGDIASAFGIGHYASVSVAANRLKGMVNADEALGRDVQRVRDRLEAKARKGKNKNTNRRKS